MRHKKDVELMNRFELMNEVERLRSKDRFDALESEVMRLKYEVKLLRADKERLERRLRAMKGDDVVQRVPDRRREPQGRRREPHRVA